MVHLLESVFRFQKKSSLRMPTGELVEIIVHTFQGSSRTPSGHGGSLVEIIVHTFQGSSSRTGEWGELSA